MKICCETIYFVVLACTPPRNPKLLDNKDRPSLVKDVKLAEESSGRFFSVTLEKRNKINSATCSS